MKNKREEVRAARRLDHSIGFASKVNIKFSLMQTMPEIARYRVARASIVYRFGCRAAIVTSIKAELVL